MFYETKVLDAHGNLKQIISAQELQSRHWHKFQESESNLGIYPKKNSSTPARKKRSKGLALEHH